MDIFSGLSTQMSIGSPEFGTQKAAMTTVVQWTKILEFDHSRLRNTARSGTTFTAKYIDICCGDTCRSV